MEENKEQLQDPLLTQEPVKEEVKKPEVSKPGVGIKAWVRVLAFLFLLSAASGIYIILSGGTCPAPEEEQTAESKGVSLASFSKMAKGDEPGVAIVKIKSVISEDTGGGWGATPSASTIAKRIKTLGENKNVKAIVLDINSPGGTVGATQEIYEEILRVRKEKDKKVVAMFRDIGASGAYYIAAACDKIIAQPGTITGSIGVIFQTGNFEGLADKVGIKFSAIKSGQHKDIGSAWRPMTQEEKTLLQNMIDDTYQQFFDAVKASRTKVNPIELKVYADGRVFSGRQAFSIGLIDALGGETEAVKLAGELAGLKDPKVIQIKTDSFKDLLFGLSSGVQESLFKKQIQSMATPRLEYMWTM